MNTYFVDGLRETEEDGIFSVDDDEAEFWTVYRRDHDGCGMAMFDLLFKEEAETLVQVLEERDGLLLEIARLKDVENGGALAQENALLRRALTLIAEWNCFPEVTLSDGCVAPYSSAYGSNGERNFIRALAREALQKSDSAD